MQTSSKHFAIILAGGALVLVLLAAGNLKAQSFSDSGEQIQGIGGSFMDTGFNSATTANVAQEEPTISGQAATTGEAGTSGDQGATEKDHWFRWRWHYHYHYHYHHCHYYQPVRYYYSYYPVVTYYPAVVPFDGVNSQSGDSLSNASDTLVPDGQVRLADSL